MATFVLHANTPCAGKGNVSTLSGPNHSIAVSVAGVGAVFAQFQVWGREDGGEHGKINGLVTVSGTTSATQTVTFTGRYKEIWLELVGISAASTFSATITTLETEFATKAELDAAVAANGGQSLGPAVSVAGVLWGWVPAASGYQPSTSLRYASFAALNAALPPSAALNGAIAEYGMIVGSGYVRARCNGTRWATMVGQSPVVLANPFSVEPVADTNTVDTALFTAPAGLLGVGEEWELALPGDTRTNTGTDSLMSLIGVSVLLAQSILTQSFGACLARFVISSTSSFRRTFAQSLVTGRVNIATDTTAPIAFVGRYTPATIGNAIDVRLLRLTRIG